MKSRNEEKLTTVTAEIRLSDSKRKNWLVFSGFFLFAIALGGVLANLSFLFPLSALVFLLLIFSLVWDLKIGIFGLTLARINLDAFHEKLELSLGQFRSFSLPALFGILIFVFGVLYLLLKRPRFWKYPLFYPFLIFLLLCGVSAFSSLDKLNTFSELIELLSFFFIYLVIFDLFKEDSFIPLIKGILFSSVIPIFVGLAQILAHYYDLNFLGVEPNVRAYGTLTHPNVFAAYLVIFSFVVLSLFWGGEIKRFWYAIPLFLLAQLCLIFTFMRGAWFGYILALLFLGVFRFRKLLFLMIPVLLILVLFVTPVHQRIFSLFDSETFIYSSVAWRLMIWQNALPYFFSAPFTGIGFGNFQYIGFQIDKWFAVAHNDYLRLLVESGILGLSGFFVLMFSLFKLALKVAKKSEDRFSQGLGWGFLGWLLVYLIYSFSDNLLTHGGVHWYFWSFAAIIAIIHNQQKILNKES